MNPKPILPNLNLARKQLPLRHSREGGNPKASNKATI